MSFDLKKLNDGKDKDLKRVGNFEKFRKNIGVSISGKFIIEKKYIKIQPMGA